MEIKSRSGNTFSGIVTWPTLEKAQTKVKGTLANDQLQVRLVTPSDCTFVCACDMRD
jgi:hypothetical protein